MTKFYKAKGITCSFSSHYVHEENGLAESSNKVLKVATRGLSRSVSLSDGYWFYALLGATCQQNMIVPYIRVNTL